MLLGTVDGEVHGGAVLADGTKGHDLYLDGIDGWVDLGNQRHTCLGNLQHCVNGFTLSLWIKIGDKTGDALHYISSGGHTKLSHGISLKKRDGKRRMDFRLNSPGRCWVVEDPDPTVSNSWYHVIDVWHPTDGAKLYLNEILVANTTNPSSVVAGNDHPKMVIGRPNNVFIKYGRAWMDEIEIYYKAFP